MVEHEGELDAAPPPKLAVDEALELLSGGGEVGEVHLGVQIGLDPIGPLVFFIVHGVAPSD